MYHHVVFPKRINTANHTLTKDIHRGLDVADFSRVLIEAHDTVGRTPTGSRC